VSALQSRPLRIIEPRALKGDVYLLMWLIGDLYDYLVWLTFDSFHVHSVLSSEAVSVTTTVIPHHTF
jgi:hypothetical protein